MGIQDTLRDVLLGAEEAEEFEYRCETCMTTFSSDEQPSLAACPGCGANDVERV